MAHCGGTATHGAQCRLSPSRARLVLLRPANAVRRLTAAAVAAALACLPIVAVAGLSPSPAPALETMLAEPPATDFQENPKALALHGNFNLDDYISFLGPKDVNETTSMLRRDGLVGGFSDTWIQEASNHLLVEVVIAFGGKAGAKQWLGKSEQVDKSDSFYKGTIPVSGLETYYGARFADPTRALYADIISFVKGNDYFLVGLVSNANDLADIASRQTKKQFDKAPAYTIPPGQWPESAGSVGIGPLLLPAPLAFGGASVIVLVLLISVGGVVLIARRERRPAIAVAGGIPADALRSEDGYYWWDGESWRPVDQASEPPAEAPQAS